jgi:4-amino-4-deoxy-L-arabinose transferase-like glycosyltransferase
MKALLRQPLGLLSLAIVFALVVPVLFMDGMFIDASMYTAVGHNLANGYGSPWFLYYSVAHTTKVPGFFENPPLGYWLFALFFKLFGSSFYIERFFVLLTYIAQAWLITHLWKKFMPTKTAISWWPVLLWALCPLIFWSFTHNMMENTMGVFVLMAIVFAHESVIRDRNTYLWAALAGLMVFLAFMVKGFPGMYPLATIPLYWLFFKHPSLKKVLGLSTLMIVLAVVPIVVLFLLPVSGESLSYYLFNRTLGRINNIPTVSNRFAIVWELIQQMLVPFALSTIAFVIFKWKRRTNAVEHKKLLGFLLLLGLCGVLPLAITKVQRVFYLVPAIPLIALALAVWTAKPIMRFQERIKAKASRNIRIVAYLLIGGVVVVTVVQAGTPKRDKAILQDVDAIGQIIGQHDTITAPKSIAKDWGVKAYFMRRHFIQMDNVPFETDTVPVNDWLLLKKGSAEVPTNYQFHAGFNRYDLYSLSREP